MTTKQEQMNPVLAVKKADGFIQPQFPSEEALVVLGLTPEKTVWGGPYGKPVYDRLPQISEQYKKAFDRDQAYVYLHPTQGKFLGPGSLQVGRLERDWTQLFIENGEVTWKEGQLPLSRLDVNTKDLNFGAGLDDGSYQVGYRLFHDRVLGNLDFPGYAVANVVDSSLAEANVLFAASTETEIHTSYQAIADPEVGDESWWPNDIAKAGDYFPGSWFVVDFRLEVDPVQFVLNGDSTQVNTAKCALYWSDDAITWYFSDQTTPENGSWDFLVSARDKARYWKFFFWDGDATISQIIYSGEALFPDRQARGVEQYGEPFIEGLYDEIEGNYLLLATFTIRKGVITEIIDQRRVTNRKYEPVAEWLTDFQDTSLKCLFDDVELYAEKFLAPPSADFHLYDEMDDSLCYGQGYIKIGEINEDAIFFPDIVEINSTKAVRYYGDRLLLFEEAPPVGFFSDPNGLFSPVVDDSARTDPDDISIFTEGQSWLEAESGVAPKEIILLQDPVDASDLATAKYTIDTLTLGWSIDNGTF